MKRINAAVTPATHIALRRIAKSQLRSVRAVVMLALEEYVAKHLKPKP